MQSVFSNPVHGMGVVWLSIKINVHVKTTDRELQLQRL